MVLGATAALLANVFFAVGFVLKKRALSKLPPLRAGEPGRLVRLLGGSPLWLLGLGCLLLGLAAQMRAYQTLPIAVAQGIFVAGMVLLLLLSPVVLGERPTRRDRWGAVLVVTALGMIVGSLAQGPDTVGASARTGALLAVCVPAIAGGLVLFAAATARSRARPTGGGAAYGLALGLVYGVMALATKGLSGLFTAEREPLDLALGALTTPYAYLLVVTGAMGLGLSQMALQRSPTSLFVPVCTIVTSLFSTTSGTAVFRERLPDSPLLLGLRVSGLALGAVAVLVMSAQDQGRARPAGTGAQPRYEIITTVTAAPLPFRLSAPAPVPVPVVSSRTVSVTLPPRRAPDSRDPARDAPHPPHTARPPVAPRPAARRRTL